MKKIIITLVILGVVIGFFYKNIFNPAVNITPSVGTNDLTDLNIPYRFFLNESIKKGEYPLWSSTISSGYPIFAEGQIAGLFPLNLIFTKFPLIDSVNLTIVTSYFLIFLFSFLYLKQIKLGVGAFFGSLIITFGGFAINELLHFGMLVSFYLFISQLYFLEKYFEKGKIVWIFLMGLSLGLSLLGGHPQITFYSLLFLFPYWIYFHFFIKAKNNNNDNNTVNTINNSKKHVVKSVFKFIGRVSIFVFTGIGIGAGQILPQIEFTLNSTRAVGLTAESISKFSLKFNDLVSFFSPFWVYAKDVTYESFVTNGWPIDERYVYIGLLGIFLAILGLIRAFKNKLHDPYSKIFSITLIFSLLASFGTNITFGQLYTLPPFSFFRLPLRMIFLTSISLGVLVAMVSNDFYNWLSYKKTNVSLKFILLLILFLGLFIDLKINAEKLHPPTDALSWYKTPEVVEFLKTNLDNEARVTTQQYFFPSARIFLMKNEIWDDNQTLINLRNLLPVFNNVLYNVPVNIGAANSAGLKIDRYNELEYEIYFNGIKYGKEDKIDVTDSWLYANRIMGVKYFLTTQPAENSLLSLVKIINFTTGQDPVYIYELSNYYQRAFMVPNAETKSPQDIKKDIFEGNFNPQNKILIEENTDWGSKGGFSASTEMVNYQDQLVTIKTQSSSDGFLFLSDTYYPGWKVYVDGVEKKILRANFAFRAVEVPAGEHLIEFKYKPDSFYWGLRISILSLIFVSTLILLYIIINSYRNRRRNK